MENNLIDLDVFKKVFRVEKSIYENILKGDTIFFEPLENYKYFNILVHRDKYTLKLCAESLEEFSELFYNLNLSKIDDKFDEIRFCFECIERK